MQRVGRRAGDVERIGGGVVGQARRVGDVSVVEDDIDRAGGDRDAQQRALRSGAEVGDVQVVAGGVGEQRDGQRQR